MMAISKVESFRELANTPGLAPATAEDLATRESTDRRIATLDARLKVLNRALNGWARFARTSDEIDRVRDLEAERDRLIGHRVGLLERRCALDSAEQTTWHRAFQRAVKECTPEPEYRRLIDRADQIVADARRRAGFQSVGAAIEPTGATGAMRTRK